MHFELQRHFAFGPFQNFQNRNSQFGNENLDLLNHILRPEGRTRFGANILGDVLGCLGGCFGEELNCACIIGFPLQLNQRSTFYQSVL